MDRLTFDAAEDGFPLWSPDDQQIAFSSRREKTSIYWKAADNTGTEELLVSGSGPQIDPRSWARNGKSLIFEEQKPGINNADIEEIMMEGDRVKKPLLNENYTEIDPQVSPNGRWMAYSSKKSGQFEIYVCPYPEVKGEKWQVSTGGGAWPLWQVQNPHRRVPAKSTSSSTGLKI